MHSKKNRSEKKKELKQGKSIKILNHNFLQTSSTKENNEENKITKDIENKIKEEKDNQIELKNVFSYEEEPEIKKLRLAKEEQLRFKEEQNQLKIKFDKEYEEKLIEKQKKKKELENKKMTTDFEGNVIMIKNVPSNKLASDFVQPIFNYNIKSNTISHNEMKVNRQPSNHNIIPITNDKINKQYNSDNHNMLNKVSPEISTEESDKKVVQPIGSNFDLFVPEVGVTIQEGDKHKSGGKDFQSVYNKHSKYDYFSMMRKENKLSNYNKFVIEDNKPSTGEASSNRNGVTSLPLIQNKNTSNDGIKVNNKIKTSIKGVLDTLDIYPEYEQIETANVQNNVDIFKKRKNYLDQKSKEKEGFTNSLEEINKFNYNILKNNQWGQQTYLNKAGETVRIPIKPSKKELERELGKNIVNKKMPRSRLSTNIMKR